jgi:hypothetical protein
MLPLGRLGPHPGEGEPRETKFTRDEQRTMLTLWSIFRSPLMMGGDLPSCDPWTTSLLTNREVIAVDQHSTENRPVITTDSTVIWTARPESGPGYYVAAFNISDREQEIRYEWKELQLPESIYEVRDLWSLTNLGTAKSLAAKLRPHASLLYRVNVKR